MIDQPLIEPDLIGFRRDHILNRHRFGAGKPGKTEFPSTWSDNKILTEVNSVANSRVPFQANKYGVHKIGIKENIEIRVDFYPNNHPSYSGNVSTAYPTNVAPNPPTPKTVP